MPQVIIATQRQLTPDDTKELGEVVANWLKKLEPPRADWTGNKCPKCGGCGEDDDARTCGYCAGTGEEYA